MGRLGKSEPIDDRIFVRGEFSWRAPVNGQDIKARLRHPAFGGINQCGMFVVAATVDPTVGPGGLVVNVVEGRVAMAQARHDLGKELNWPDRLTYAF